MSATVDATVRLQALDGTWETCGADRAIGVNPDTLTYSHNEWGPDKASFDLHRSVIALWPDLGAFTPVEIEIGGVIVWEGRTAETPTRAGAEQVINVQSQGWQYHLDDDVYERMYVHSKLSDWKDSRSMLNAPLGSGEGCYPSGGQVSNDKGAITVMWPNGTPWSALARTSVTLDLGPTGSAVLVEVDYESSKNDGANSLLQILNHNTDALEIKGAVTVTNGAAASGTLTISGIEASRYFSVMIQNQGGARTPGADVWFRLKAIRVYALAEYESAGASVLHASTIVPDALARATLLLSDDLSQIASTTFPIPDFTLSKASTPREAIEAANAYHNWVTKLLIGRRMSYQPRPTAPVLEIGAWSGAEIEDASANNGAEIYNRALVEAQGPDGSPLMVDRSASQQPGVDFVVPISPAPDNPSFAVNATSWTASAGTAITRDTGVFDSGPASGRWDNGAGGAVAVGKTLTETFSGTFLAGSSYRLTLKLRATSATDRVTARFGLVGEDAAALVSIAPPVGSFSIVTLMWTPTQTRTGVTLQLEAFPFGLVTTTGPVYVDTLVLTETTPTLVDRRGFRRTKVTQMSSAITPAEGNQLADIFLQAHMTTPFKGAVAVSPGGVRRVLGGQPVHPSQIGLHTQELLRVAHMTDPDTGGIGRDGTIAEVSYTHKDQKAQVTIDDKRANFDALLARLAVVQSVGS